MRKIFFNRIRFRHLIAAVLLTALLLSACTLFPPTPTAEQILQAVAESNKAQTEPLELIYEEMQVPHRSPGRAGAVVWVEDKSIQRNFTIAYDRKAKTFYVESLSRCGSGRWRLPE
jgi:hypothetical protein